MSPAAAGWLQLRAPLITPLAPLTALERNRRLPGFAKLALVDGGGMEARAEIPTDVVESLERRVRDSEAGMAAADGDQERELRISSQCVPDASALGALCEAAGWPYTASHLGRLAVDLGLHDVVARARIEQSAVTGAVRVAVELDAIGLPLGEVCGAALAVFLLRAAAVVRLVRPALELRRVHAVVGFEAVYATPPEPRELAHALAALYVAAEMTSREAVVLGRDPAMARAYLDLDGSCSPADPAGPTATAGMTPAKGEAR